MSAIVRQRHIRQGSIRSIYHKRKEKDMGDISLFGRLRCKTKSGEVAGADQIRDAAFILADGTTNPTQSQINAELKSTKKGSFEELDVLDKSYTAEIRPSYIVFFDSDHKMLFQLSASGLSFYNHYDLDNLGKLLGTLDATMFMILKTITDKMLEGYNIVFEKATSTSSDTEE